MPSTRAALVAALAQLPDCRPHPSSPPTPQPGDAWPVWEESRWDAGQCVVASRWRVLWLLPPLEAVDHVDDAAVALVLALTATGGDPIASPTTVPAGPDQGLMPAVSVTLVVEESP
jgi:hypothetical protein